jgi:hypothetical protein
MEHMSFLPYPPPPESGWYDDDVTALSGTALSGVVRFESFEQGRPMQNGPIQGMRPAMGTQAAVQAEPLRDDSEDRSVEDWDSTVLSSSFTMKQPKHMYMLHNDMTGQDVIVDISTLLGRKPSADVPEGAKSVRLEDPTRTISRNHAAISFDRDGSMWLEDYGSLNGTYIIHGDEEIKVEGRPMQLEAPVMLRIGDQFFSFEER